MHQAVIELSHVDCLLVPVVAGFLVEVIRLGLQGIYCSRICCHLRCVWIVAIRSFVARFIQFHTNYIVISPILSYLGSQNVLEVNEPVLIVRSVGGPVGSKHVALYVLLMVIILDVLDGSINTLFKHGTHRDK